MTGDMAMSQAYVYAFHRRLGSVDFLHDWGRWVDQLRKGDGQWLFTRREVVGAAPWCPTTPNEAADMPATRAASRSPEHRSG